MLLEHARVRLFPDRVSAVLHLHLVVKTLVIVLQVPLHVGLLVFEVVIEGGVQLFIALEVGAGGKFQAEVAFRLHGLLDEVGVFLVLVQVGH